LKLAAPGSQFRVTPALPASDQSLHIDRSGRRRRY